MTLADHSLCPLCQSGEVSWFHRDSRRDYWRCEVCRLIHVPDRFHLSASDEKAHYDNHQNNPADAGYRRFLGRLFAPLSRHLAPRSRGLDFGCGPGPALALMFAEQGDRVELYDAYYAPDTSVLAGSYDFVTATEVVEHLRHPGAVLMQLWDLLRCGGVLGVMTSQLADGRDFSSWHYKNDPTHIAFFSRWTFLWLGKRWGVDPVFEGDDVVLFRKP